MKKSFRYSSYHTIESDATEIMFKSDSGHLLQWQASKEISEINKILTVGDTYEFNGKVSSNFELSGEKVTKFGGTRKFTKVEKPEIQELKSKNKTAPSL